MNILYFYEENNMITFFTDTDCDVTPKEAREHGFKLISMPYIIGEETIYPFKDSDDFDYHAFYDVLRKGIIPKTAALSPMEYMEYFEPEFAKGNDIFYIHFSRAMSGTFNSMNLALEELKEKYPERKFYEIDTKGITLMSYVIIQEFYKQVEAGKSPEELLKWGEEEVLHFACYFYASDLKFFARSGRVSGFKAFMGNLIGIKPIIYMDDKGIMGQISSGHGMKKTLKAILDYMVKLQNDILDYEIVIAHTDAPATVEVLKDMIMKEFGEKARVRVIYANPTAGSHCGPDNVGVGFHSISR